MVYIYIIYILTAGSGSDVLLLVQGVVSVLVVVASSSLYIYYSFGQALILFM